MAVPSFFSDPKFLSLSPADRRAVADQLDPQFAALPDSDKDQVIFSLSSQSALPAGQSITYPEKPRGMAEDFVTHLGIGAEKYIVMPVAQGMQMFGSATGMKPVADAGTAINESAKGWLSRKEQEDPSMTWSKAQSAGDYAQWAGEQITEFLPQLAISAATGGAAGLAGKTLASSAIKRAGMSAAAEGAAAGEAAALGMAGRIAGAKGVESAAELAPALASKMGITEDLARAALTVSNAKDRAAYVGTVLGTGMQSIGMEAGTIYDAQTDKNIPKALAYGAVAGALDTALPAYVLKKTGLYRLLPGLGQEVAESAAPQGSRIKQALKLGALGMAEETPQEGTQTILERLGADQKLQSDAARKEGFFTVAMRDGIKAAVDPEAWNDIIESAATGGLIGGVFGAGAGAMTAGTRDSGLGTGVEGGTRDSGLGTGANRAPSTQTVGAQGVAPNQDTSAQSPVVTQNPAPVTSSPASTPAMTPPAAATTATAVPPPAPSGPLTNALAAGGMSPAQQIPVMKDVTAGAIHESPLQGQPAQGMSPAKEPMPLITPEQQQAKEELLQSAQWAHAQVQQGNHGLMRVTGEDARSYTERILAAYRQSQQPPAAPAQSMEGGGLNGQEEEGRQGLLNESLPTGETTEPAGAEPTAAPADQKQPWQMRSVELSKKGTESVFSLETKVEVVNGKPVYTYWTDVAHGDGTAHFEISAKSQPTAGVMIERLHKKIIQQALSEGKPVPAEVLADYPELQQGKEDKPNGKTKENIQSTNGAVVNVEQNAIKWLHSVGTASLSKNGKIEHATDINQIKDAVEKVKAAGAQVEHTTSPVSGNLVWKISESNGNRYQLVVEPSGRGTWHQLQSTSQNAPQATNAEQGIATPAPGPVYGKPLKNNKHGLVLYSTIYGDTGYVKQSDIDNPAKIQLPRYRINGERVSSDNGRKITVIHRENLVDQSDPELMKLVADHKRLNLLEAKAKKNQLTPEELKEAQALTVSTTERMDKYFPMTGEAGTGDQGPGTGTKTEPAGAQAGTASGFRQVVIDDAAQAFTAGKKRIAPDVVNGIDLNADGKKLWLDSWDKANLAGAAKEQTPATNDIPQVSIDRFNDALQSRNVLELKMMVHPDNKNWRKMFEDATGLKLPRGVQASERMVEEWRRSVYASAGMNKPKVSYPDFMHEVDRVLAEDKTLQDAAVNTPYSFAIHYMTQYRKAVSKVMHDLVAIGNDVKGAFESAQKNTKEMLVGKMDKYRDAAKKAATAAKDPNIGREWNSEWGKQRIVRREDSPSGSLYDVETVGTADIRRYKVDTIETTIKNDEHRITPEYAKEQEERKAKAEQNRLAEEKRKEREAQVQAEITKFTTAAGMSDMQAGKAREALLKQLSFDGKLLSRKEMIDERVNRGYTVTGQPGSRRFETQDGAGLDEKTIGKTAMDYAQYVINQAAVTSPESRVPSPGSSNTVFTHDAYLKAKEVMRQKLSQLNAGGIDPELMQAGFTIAGYHIESGARKFTSYAAAMIEDFGEVIRPYLKAFYNGVRDLPGIDHLTGEMDDYATVAGVNINDLGKQLVEKPEKPATLDADQTRKGQADDDTRDDRTGAGSLETVPAGVQADAEERTPAKRGGRSGEPDTTGDGHPETRGDDGRGSLASESGAVYPDGPGERVQDVEAIPTPVSQPETPQRSGVNPGNYRITEADNIGAGTPGQKISGNLAAIRLVKELDRGNRYPTREEQAVLAKYVGWGGLKNVFNPTVAKKQEREAHDELKQLLTETEFFEARQSVLNAFYTSPQIISSIYKILRHFGFSGGYALEPTYGVGPFIGLMPGDMAASSKWYGSELDPITAKIGQYLYPDARLLNAGFQKADFPYAKFDLAIGNPPFGDERITDTAKNRAAINGFKIHNYVIAKSGLHLKPGGIMAMVVTNRFLDTANPEARDYLAQNFKFLTALRLPNNTFAKNAGTEVTTDLVFFQRLLPDEKASAQHRAWLETGAVMTNAAGEEVTLNRFFADHPDMMLGEPSMKGTMYGGQWREGGKGEFALEARSGQDTAALIDELLQGEQFAKLKDILAERIVSAADATATEILMNRNDVGIGGFISEGDDVLIRRDDDEHGNVVFEKLTPASNWNWRAWPLKTIRDILRSDNWRKRDQELMQALTSYLGTRENPDAPDGETTSAKTTSKLGTMLQKVLKGLEKSGALDKLTQGEEFTKELDTAIRRSELGLVNLARIKGMLRLRNMTYELIRLERADSPKINRQREELNREYDNFVRKFGYINDPANAKYLADDIKIEFGLEDQYRKEVTVTRAKAMGVKAQPSSAKKATILEQRIFYPHKEITSVATPRDGYVVSLSEKGRLDLEYIAQLTGKERDEVISDLAEAGLIFADPEKAEWFQEDAYLSGNVKAKLKAVEGRDGYEKNVEALTKVLPKDLTPDEVFVGLGATWVPDSVYMEFAQMLGIQSPSISIQPALGTVSIAVNGGFAANDVSVALENQDYSVAELFNLLANKKPVVAYDYDADGKRTVNKERTKLLAPIAKRFNAIWRDWIMADTERADTLTKLYNDTQNTHAKRIFNGQLLRTVGNNPAIVLRNSQRNASWRMIQSPVVLLDHVVGAGKTFTIITGVMERVRLGLTKKPLIVVPNHLVGQWAKDWLKLYPGANILAASEKDFARKNRRRLFSRIATGKFDAIIIGHSSLSFIPLEPETERGFIQEEIQYLEKALYDAEKSEDRRAVRTITNRIAKKRERMTKLMDKVRDDVASFESMGIDYLTLDESHEFKNLEYTTLMQNVAGMGTPTGSQKAFDLYAKIQYLRSREGGITFATGTPISNSLVEMYSLLRYLNREGLQNRNIENFDAWAKNYSTVENRIEYTAAQKLKDRNVIMFEGNALPELLQLYNEFADSITMADLKRIYAEQIRERNTATGEHEREEFPVPKVKEGGRTLEVTPPTAAQREYMDYLVARATRLEQLGGQNDPRTDNSLWVMSDARKMALDIRLVDPAAGSDPDNKVNRSAAEIKRIYDQWHADKGTQLVFCDLSTPAKFAGSDARSFINQALKQLVLEKDKKTRDYLDALPDYRTRWAWLKDKIEQKIEQLDAVLATEAPTDSERQSLDRMREGLDRFLQESVEEEASLLTADIGFSVYDDLKATLVGMGIPENEIRFIHEAGSTDKKKELFAMVNSGEVRILLGSSKKMGAGTNAQERIVALHHLDAPWRPADVEQREGRAIRQGNRLYERDPDGFELEIKAYSTGNTFDAVMWGVLARKAETLEQFRNGDRNFKDVVESDSEGYATFMATSTGNPAFKEKYELEGQIEELEGEERRTTTRRASSQRIVDEGGMRIRKQERDIRDAQRAFDKVKDATGFDFDGKHYQEDLEEAQEKANEEHRKARDQWIREGIAYTREREQNLGTAMQPWMDANPEPVRPGWEVTPAEYTAYNEQREAWRKEYRKESDKHDKAWQKEHPKPKEPGPPTLARLARESEAGQLVKELVKRLSAEGDEDVSLTVKYGTAVYTFTRTPADNDKDSTFTIDVDGLGYTSQVGPVTYTQQNPSEARMLVYFRDGAIKQAFRNRLRDEESILGRVKERIKEAELILDKVKFTDGPKLEKMRARYEEVVAEVNRLEEELAAQREEGSNKYIEQDTKRFSGERRTARRAERTAKNPDPFKLTAQKHGEIDPKEWLTALLIEYGQPGKVEVRGDEYLIDDLLDDGEQFEEFLRDAEDRGFIVGESEDDKTPLRYDPNAPQPEWKQRDLRYSRSTSPANLSPEHHREIADALAPIIAKLAKIVPIKVVQKQSEVPGRHTADFNAVFHEGTIYLVSSKVESPEAAQALLLDHELRHFGLQGILPAGQYGMVMGQVYRDHKDAVEQLAGELGIDTRSKKGRDEAADEYVVSLARQAEKSPLLNRIITIVRNALRNLGFTLKISDAELLDLVRSAKVANTQGEMETRYSRLSDSLTSNTTSSYEMIKRVDFGRTGNYKTDFVTVGGSIDLWHIPEFSNKKYREAFPPMPVRLHVGRHEEKFGIDHVAKGHPEIKNTGLTPEQYVYFILRNTTKIFVADGGNRLFLRAAGKPAGSIIAELRKEKGGYYSVVTAFDKQPFGQIVWSGRPAGIAESLIRNPVTSTATTTEQSASSSSLTARGQISPKPVLDGLEDQTKYSIASLDKNVNPRYSRITDTARRVQESIGGLPERYSVLQALNPLDWSRFTEFVDDITPGALQRWIAYLFRNPIFEAEKDPRKQPVVTTAQEREVDRTHTTLNLLRYLGEGELKTLRQRGKEWLTTWDKSDPRTYWGVLWNRAKALSDGQMQALNTILFEGDINGRSYETLAYANQNPRVRDAKLAPETFQLFRDIRDHMDLHVSAEIEKMFAERYLEAAKQMSSISQARADLTDEQRVQLDEALTDWVQRGEVYQKEQRPSGMSADAWGVYEMIRERVHPSYIKSIADVRQRHKEMKGWVHRYHGDGEYRAVVRQVIDRLAYNITQRTHGKMKAELKYYPGHRLAKELQSIADRIAADSPPASFSYFTLDTGRTVIEGGEEQVQRFVDEAQTLDLANPETGEYERVMTSARYVPTRWQAKRLMRKWQQNLQQAMPYGYLPDMRYEVTHDVSSSATEEMYGDVNDQAVEKVIQEGIDRMRNRGDLTQEEYNKVIDEAIWNTGEALLSRAAGKYQIRRAGYLIEGYDRDNAMQLFHDYQTGIAGQHSKAIYAMRQAAHFRTMAPETQRWAYPYIKHSLRNMGAFDRASGVARSIATFFYLGLKPASVIVNATQPWTLGIAELGQIVKNPWKILGAAQRDIFKDNLSDDERELFTTSIWKAQEMETATMEAAGLHMGGFRNRLGHNWQIAVNKALAPFQEMELLNRKSTILAAYRAHRQQGIAADEATTLALKLNDKVNFDMSQANLPGFARNPVGRTVYALQSFGFNTLNWVYNRATSGQKKDMQAILRFVGMIALIGGATAIPGGDELDKLYRRLFGISLKLEAQTWLKKNLKQYGTPGEALYAFVWHGSAGLTGINISNSLRVQLPFISPWLDGDTLPESLGGVYTGLGQKLVQAGKATARGDVLRAAENLAPEFVAAPLRAYRQADRGMTTMGGRPVFDANGRPIKYTAGEAATRALGFQPLEKSDQAEISRTGKALQAQWNQERQELIDAWKIARPGEDRRAAWVKIMQWNRELRQSQVWPMVKPIKLESVTRQAKPDAGKTAWLREQE